MSLLKLIKNYRKLAKTNFRKIALNILDYGLKSLNYHEALNNLFHNKEFLKNILNYKNIYLIGFGKGSSEIVKILSENVSIKLGYVIDFKKIQLDKNIISFKGTHPLPSYRNLSFSKILIEKFSGKMTNNDLVLVVVCGGGSAMLTNPIINLDKFIQVNNELLRSGANIYEMNTVRKHLDTLKGGGLAKILYPAKIISLVFSDVPGNDLSFIASGPTIYDKTTIKDSLRIIKKYKIKSIKSDDLLETPKENKYFKNNINFLVLSNKTALEKMLIFAESHYKLKGKIVSDNLKGDVKEIAKYFFNLIKKSKYDFLLAGGETTVKINGKGVGGRNQELALRFLNLMKRYNLCFYISRAFKTIGSATNNDYTKNTDNQQYSN